MPHEHLAPAEWFTRWWSPAEFFPMVCRHNNAIPSAEFLARPEFQPLREAFIAGFFSWILAQHEHVLVRLAENDFPDFALKLNGAVVEFEIVEAPQLGRRRAEEYREAARREAVGVQPTLRDFDIIEMRKAAIPALQLAVQRKAAKKYKPPPHLLVYVNFPLFTPPPLTPDQFGELLADWRESFPAVWLLWGAYATRCWPHPVRHVGIPPGVRP